jgi:FkbM family methyltransferase
MAILTQEQFDNLTAMKCAVADNCYGAYCVPLSSKHRPAAHTVLSGDVYEPQTIEFMRSHCANGDIVHAGTYFGDFLPGLAPACQGTVWAFEPNRENYRCAQITLLLNDINNVELRRAGLGATNQEMPLLTADADGLPRGGSSQIVSDQTPPAGQIEMVPMVCIDDAIGSDRQVSIIQLDVEGHEQQALSGALQTITRCLPVLIIEILADSTLLSTDWFKKNILPLGYRMTGMIHGNMVFIRS